MDRDVDVGSGAITLTIHGEGDWTVRSVGVSRSDRLSRVTLVAGPTPGLATITQKYSPHYEGYVATRDRDGKLLKGSAEMVVQLSESAVTAVAGALRDSRTEKVIRMQMPKGTFVECERLGMIVDTDTVVLPWFEEQRKSETPELVSTDYDLRVFRLSFVSDWWTRGETESVTTDVSLKDSSVGVWLAPNTAERVKDTALRISAAVSDLRADLVPLLSLMAVAFWGVLILLAVVIVRNW